MRERSADDLQGNGEGPVDPLPRRSRAGGGPPGRRGSRVGKGRNRGGLGGRATAGALFPSRLPAGFCRRLGPRAPRRGQAQEGGCRSPAVSRHDRDELPPGSSRRVQDRRNGSGGPAPPGEKVEASRCAHRGLRPGCHLPAPPLPRTPDEGGGPRAGSDEPVGGGHPAPLPRPEARPARRFQGLRPPARARLKHRPQRSALPYTDLYIEYIFIPARRWSTTCDQGLGSSR